MSEELHEALLELEQARRRERVLRQESERLLEGLAILTSATSTGALFTQLLEVCRAPLDFEEACVLHVDEGGALRVVAATCDALRALPWRKEHLCMSSGSRRAGAFYDIAEVAPFGEARGHGQRSALAMDLGDGGAHALLVCTHSNLAHFGAEQVRLAERMAPLFAQAVRSAAAFQLEKRARREARAQLSRAAARLDALLRQMHNGVLLADHDGKVALANEAVCRLFGLAVRPEELVGRTCPEVGALLAPQAADPEAFVLASKALVQKQHIVTEDRVVLADGRVLERDHVPIFHEGEPVGVLWEYKDATRRVEMQDKLRESKEQAEAASAAKTTFLATLSHEIRTPLNAVLGMTSLALGTELDQEQRGYLRSVRTNSEALLHLLSDILDFSRIESGRVELDEVAFDLGAVAEEVVEVLSVRAFEKGLDVAVEIAPEVPARLIGDPNRMRQVLMNLVGNAIKYTARGHVMVSMGAQKTAGGRCRVLIEVHDTGVGMSEQVAARIFERFYRAPGQGIEGSGLGLAISHELVSRMGGSIDVESFPSMGSIFTVQVELPVTRHEDPSLEGLRMRLADKVAWFVGQRSRHRSVARRMMEALGVEVHVASSVEAMRARATAPADFVVVSPEQAAEVGGLSCQVLLLQDPALNLPGLAANVHRVFTPVTRAAVWTVLDALTCSTGAHARRRSNTPVPLQRVSGRVLVVEDNRDNQRVARSQLERAGYEVVVAETGHAGVDTVLAGGVDLVLLDVDLPDISGIDVAKRITSALGPSARPPMVAFTAHTTDRMRRACLDAGMAGFLAKPVSRGALLSAIAHHLEAPVRRVLVADDASDSRLVVAHYLDAEGFEVEECSDGIAALERVGRADLDLLVLDVEMPGLDGRSVLQKVRANPHTARLPVVLVTGHDQPELRAEVARSQPCGHVVKPLRREALMREVKDVLRVAGADVPSSPAAPPLAAVSLDPDIAALVPAYVSRSLASLEEVRVALESSDLEPARRVAHQLKGTGASYGLPEITELARVLEAALKEDNLEEARRFASCLQDALTQRAPPSTPMTCPVM